MRISTKGRYALRLMVDLAMNNSGEMVRMKEIAERQNISEKYLEQIIAVLKKAGYVRSLRGSQGGYQLAKSPKDYTVGNGKCRQLYDIESKFMKRRWEQTASRRFSMFAKSLYL